MESAIEVAAALSQLQVTETDSNINKNGAYKNLESDQDAIFASIWQESAIDEEFSCGTNASATCGGLSSINHSVLAPAIDNHEELIFEELTTAIEGTLNEGSDRVEALLESNPSLVNKTDQVRRSCAASALGHTEF